MCLCACVFFMYVCVCLSVFVCVWPGSFPETPYYKRK